MDKDVRRTDRGHPFFVRGGGPNLKMLRNVLMSYAMYNFDLGYVQVGCLLRACHSSFVTSTKHLEASRNGAATGHSNTLPGPDLRHGTIANAWPALGLRQNPPSVLGADGIGL